MKSLIPGLGFPNINIKIYSCHSSKWKDKVRVNTEEQGLGLTISKRFMEMMSGTIDIQSEVGKGTVFRLYLSAVAISDCDENILPEFIEPLEDSYLNGKNIMIVGRQFIEP